MKNLIPIIVINICIISCNNNTQKEAAMPDLKSYYINLGLDTQKRIMDITSIVNIEIPGTPSKIDFLFSHFADIKHLSINDVANTDYKHQNDTLSLNMKHSGNIDLSIIYTLPTDSFIDSGVIILKRELKWCPFRYNDISEFSAAITVPKNLNVYSSGLIEKDSNNIGNENRFHTFNELNSG